MIEDIYKWFRKFFNKIVHSIGFLPGVIGMGFFLTAIAVLEMDFLAWGLQLKRQFKWLALKDAETARTIVATVTTGVISLTVFSFSMVMIVINQAATQMSNRMLDNIIKEKTQQIVLGLYIGTIVFALFLLTNISETEQTVFIPYLSVYFLLLLTVFDVFLFVYFLHYTTQTIRYEQLIKRIHNKARNILESPNGKLNTAYSQEEAKRGKEICSVKSGYYQGFNEDHLLKLAEANNLIIDFLHPKGTYILKGTPLLSIHGIVEDNHLKELLINIDFYDGQEIDKNVYYGFFHLTEVAVKALSPGINDPGTAVLCINALTDLFACIINQPIANVIKDKKDTIRITIKNRSFEDLFHFAVLPIWDYGKNDRMVQHGLTGMLKQLSFIEKAGPYKSFFERFHESYLVSKDVDYIF